MNVTRIKIQAGRQFRIIAVGIILLTMGAGVWLAARSPEHVTYAVGSLPYAHHAALRFEYPADWKAAPEHQRNNCVPTVVLRPRASAGLQERIDDYVFRNGVSGWGTLGVYIRVYPINTVPDLDVQARWLKTLFLHPCSYKGTAKFLPTQVAVRRFTGEKGSLFEFEDPWSAPGSAIRVTEIYPSARPGAPRYEIEIRCLAKNTLKRAAYQIADHIVTSLKLVNAYTDKQDETGR